MYLCRKRTVEVCFRPISRSDRKNLAVHVSLSSIFTMSKSGPRDPLSGGRRQWKQSFLILGNRTLLPVTRQQSALSEYRCSRAAEAVCISDGRVIWLGVSVLSTPEHDKTDENLRTKFRLFLSEMPRRCRRFVGAASAMGAIYGRSFGLSTRCHADCANSSAAAPGNGAEPAVFRAFAAWRPVHNPQPARQSRKLAAFSADQAPRPVCLTCRAPRRHETSDAHSGYMGTRAAGPAIDQPGRGQDQA